MPKSGAGLGTAMPPEASDAARPAQRLRHRAEFVAVGRGQRVHLHLMSLQGLAVSPSGLTRFGFTITKKEGGAVERNRIRRRLREALRHMSPPPAQTGHDYVIIGRRSVLSASFVDIGHELARALAKLHRAKPYPRPSPGGPDSKPRETGTSHDARQ